MEITLTFEEHRALIVVDIAITSDNAYLFQKKLEEVLKSDMRRLEIDFSACKIICSTGIGQLIKFYKDFSVKKGEVEVIRCSVPVYDLFTTIKLSQLIPINL